MSNDVKFDNLLKKKSISISYEIIYHGESNNINLDESNGITLVL
jgi:hypothetical protein